LNSAGLAADLPTKEITSNNILGFAGNGDTLWMLTDQGINMTIASSDTLSWLGYKAPLRALSMAFGGKNVVLCLDTANGQTINKLWFYSHSNHSFDSTSALYNSNLIKSPVVKSNVNFLASAACYGAGYFWLANNDGGLLRFDPNTKSFRAFFAGTSKSFAPSDVTLDSAVFGIFDSASLLQKRISGVAVSVLPQKATSVLAMTSSTVFLFFAQDSTWDSLPNAITDNSMTFSEYKNVFASPQSPYIFASIAMKDLDLPQLCRYNATLKKWTPVATDVSSVAFGPDSTAYLLLSNSSADKIRKIKGLKPDSTIQASSFGARMSIAMNYNTPDMVTDIAYLSKNDSVGALWIGTYSSASTVNNGLFFSRHEETDEASNAPFLYVHRERKIQTGLKEAYAVPGILFSDRSQSPDAAQTVFAYSLSKASNVTISIYDWNMNLVKNVIVNQPRPAAKDDPLGNGRSTNRKEDVWDGKNSSGKRVAVGVYYYKINAKSGERAFGKIIVAK
jgi:hypothetical protein